MSNMFAWGLRGGVTRRSGGSQREGTGLSGSWFGVWLFLGPRHLAGSSDCIFSATLKAGVSVIPTLQKRKLKPTEDTLGLSKRQRQDLNTGLTASRGELSALPYNAPVSRFSLSCLPSSPVSLPNLQRVFIEHLGRAKHCTTSLGDRSSPDRQGLCHQ